MAKRRNEAHAFMGEVDGQMVFYDKQGNELSRCLPGDVIEMGATYHDLACCYIDEVISQPRFFGALSYLRQRGFEIPDDELEEIDPSFSDVGDHAWKDFPSDVDNV